MPISDMAMMKITQKLHANKGLTLAELLVAGLIVGVIMLGIISVDLALRQSERGTSRNAIVAQRTAAMMLHIIKNVENATGSDASTGIEVDNTTPGQGKLWVRLESGGNPDTVTDDIWVCYDVSANTLRFCEVLDTNDDCNTPIAGTLESLGGIASFTPQLITDSSLGAQTFHVRITLVNQYDPAAAADPLDNPEYTLTSNIYPNTTFPLP